MVRTSEPFQLVSLMNRFMKGAILMLELLAVSEAVRRKTATAVDPKRPAEPSPAHERPKRDAVRASSAAALRRLAERLEPSPTSEAYDHRA
jgi:hypothetical protein